MKKSRCYQHRDNPRNYAGQVAGIISKRKEIIPHMPAPA
nr:MAG TPA: hypothetical protein [Caudoviricetes sp.]